MTTILYVKYNILNYVRVVKKQNNLDNFIYYQLIAEVNLCHIIISPIRFSYRY